MSCLVRTHNKLSIYNFKAKVTKQNVENTLH
jgi:hypothetical protein